jgi:hypothetical protein
LFGWSHSKIWISFSSLPCNKDPSFNTPILVVFYGAPAIGLKTSPFKSYKSKIGVVSEPPTIK